MLWSGNDTVNLVSMKIYKLHLVGTWTDAIRCIMSRLSPPRPGQHS